MVNQDGELTRSRSPWSRCFVQRAPRQVEELACWTVRALANSPELVGAASGEPRLDALLSDPVAVDFVVVGVGPVGIERCRTPAGPTASSAYARQRLHQRQRLDDVVDQPVNTLQASLRNAHAAGVPNASSCAPPTRLGRYSRHRRLKRRFTSAGFLIDHVLRSWNGLVS